MTTHNQFLLHHGYIRTKATVAYNRQRKIREEPNFLLKVPNSLYYKAKQMEGSMN